MTQQMCIVCSILVLSLVLASVLVGCTEQQRTTDSEKQSRKESYSQKYSAPTEPEGEQIRIIRSLIAAANDKDAERYVQNCDDDLEVYRERELRVCGKKAMKENRIQHFQRFPHFRSEIQFLVEIDNKVVMHDKVWLHGSMSSGANIVETFTFQGGKIVRIDVLQPHDLLR